jgi:voltage-gated potassium channel
MIWGIIIKAVVAVVRFLEFVWDTIRDHEFRALFGVVFAILLIGTLFYHGVEGWRYLDSLYFSVTTLTTVGLGDFTPKTDIGKMFTIGYVLIGIGVLLSLVNLIANHALKSRVGHHSELEFKRTILPDASVFRREKRERKYSYSG